MPRIPDSSLAALKAAVPVPRFLESRGISGRTEGADWVCTCPIPSHADQTPSFHASELDGSSVGHCFGCGWSGNVFQLAQALDGGDFVAAVRAVAAVGGPALADLVAAPAARAARPAAPAEACPLDPAARGAALEDQVLAFAHAELVRPGSAGQDYLRARGVWDPATAARFRLGFLPAGKLGRLLTAHRLDKYRVAGRELRAELTRLGWWSAQTGHATMDGRMVVPIPFLAAGSAAADCGSVATAYGRAVNKLGHGAPDHKNLSDRPVAGCWNGADWIDGNGAAVLAEAPIDALSLYVSGIRNVSCTLGVGNWTDDHLAALRAGQARDVFLAFDNDAAGNHAVPDIADQLILHGFSAYRVLLPPGQDVNDVARAAGADAPAILAQAIRDSVWLGGAPRVTVPALPPAAPAGSATSFLAAEPPAPAPVAASPAAARPELDAQEVGNDLHVTRGNRRYRVRGLGSCLSADSIRVGLRVEIPDPGALRMHQDTLELTSHRARAAFEKTAAAELAVTADLLKEDLGRLLLLCETRIEARAQAAAATAAAAAQAAAGRVPLSAAEEAAALELLRAPDLIARIEADLTACGLVGEDINKLCLYLAVTSRLLVPPSQPLAVLVQSSSAAGKSTLVDAVVDLLPEAARLRLTSISPQALSFFGREALRHKTVSIAEDEGLQEAAYLVKMLQSEGRISRATTTKDPATGQPQTVLFEVEGPVQILLTTTKAALDDELVNRCLVLAVDEAAAQTAAIQAAQRQRRTPAGYAAGSTREQIKTLHRHAQSLLKPLLVLNPYAEELTFPSHATRLRRDQPKLLVLIDTIALLHQQQRPVQELTLPDGTVVPYLAVTRDDIALAQRLLAPVFARDVEELPPPVRRLWASCAALDAAAAARGLPPEQRRFTRRELQEHSGMSPVQVHRCVEVLSQREILAEHVGAARNLRRYELVLPPPEAATSQAPEAGAAPAPAASNTPDSCALDPEQGSSFPETGPVFHSFSQFSKPDWKGRNPADDRTCDVPEASFSAAGRMNRGAAAPVARVVDADLTCTCAAAALPPAGR